MNVERDHKKARLPHHSPEDIRCRCGNLVAKKIDAGIEVKCRRCKRIAVLSWENLRENPEGLRINL